jgi:hypothetical protein
MAASEWPCVQLRDCAVVGSDLIAVVMDGGRAALWERRGETEFAQKDALSEPVRAGRPDRACQHAAGAVRALARERACGWVTDMVGWRAMRDAAQVHTGSLAFCVEAVPAHVAHNKCARGQLGAAPLRVNDERAVRHGGCLKGYSPGPETQTFISGGNDRARRCAPHARSPVCSR